LKKSSIDQPTLLIILAAFLSMIFSIYLWFFQDPLSGVFVGVWVPSILSLGALLRRR
jgi:hypothetical protein